MILDSAPDLKIGSSFELSYSENLTTTPISDNSFNYYIGVKMSGNLSDISPDAFSLTVDSVVITDSTTADNLEKVYVPHGTRKTNDINADVTPLLAPTILSMDNVINSSNVHEVQLRVAAEIGATLKYVFYNGTTSANVSGEIINTSGNLTGSACIFTVASNLNLPYEYHIPASDVVTLTTPTNIHTFSVNLLSFAGNTSMSSDNSWFSVNVIALDDAGNASITSSNVNSIASNNIHIIYDLIAPDNIQFSAANINMTSANNYSLTLSDLNDDASAVRIFVNDSSLSSNSFLSSIVLDGSDNTVTFDLSEFADGYITYSVNVIDLYGNESSSNILSGNLIKDTLAPTVSVNVITSGGNISGGNIELFLISNDISSGSNVTFHLGDNVNQFLFTESMSNTILSVNGMSNTIMLTGNAYQIFGTYVGNITVTANVIDINNNTALATNVIYYDITPPMNVNDLVITSSANAQPIFTWTDVTGADNYDLDFYYLTGGVNTLFDTIRGHSGNTLDYRLSGNLTLIGGGNHLSLGNYSVAIKPIDVFNNGNTYSDNYLWNVVVPAAPTLISPINGNVSLASANFIFQTIAEGNVYNLEVSDNVNGVLHAAGNYITSANAGTNLSFLLTSDNNVLWVADNFLAAGNYNWRMRTVDVFGHVGEWSAANSGNTFRVIAPNAPVIHAITSSVNNAYPTLSWEAVSSGNDGSYSVMSNVMKYTYEISTNIQFASNIVTSVNISFLNSGNLLGEGNTLTSANTIFSDNTLTNSSNFLSANTYYFRVAATDIYGNTGDWSSSTNYMFEVSNPDEPMVHTIADNVNNANPIISWDTISSNVKFYRYEISANSSFTSNILVSTNVTGLTSGSNIDFDMNYTNSDNFLSANTYYVQVRATDIYGNSGNWGRISFNVDNPSAPTLDTINPGQDNANVTLNWPSVSSAANLYAFEISNAGNFTSANLFAAGNTTLTSVVFNSDNNTLYSTNVYLSAGTYYARLRTFDIYGNEGVWSTSSANTFVVENPDAPYLTSPIAGASGTADPSFTWGSNQSNLATFTIWVGDDSTGSSWLTSNTISAVNGNVTHGVVYSTFTTVLSGNLSTQSNLYAKQYYWTVSTTDIYGNSSGNAIDGDGDITDLDFFVDPPAAPSMLISPIDSVATVPTPDFKWSTASEAVQYRVTVLSEDAATTIATNTLLSTVATGGNNSASSGNVSFADLV